jgi:hypothetical protein
MEQGDGGEMEQVDGGEMEQVDGGEMEQVDGGEMEQVDAEIIEEMEQVVDAEMADDNPPGLDDETTLHAGKRRPSGSAADDVGVVERSQRTDYRKVAATVIPPGPDNRSPAHTRRHSGNFDSFERRVIPRQGMTPLATTHFSVVLMADIEKNREREESTNNDPSIGSIIAGAGVGMGAGMAVVGALGGRGKEQTGEPGEQTEEPGKPNGGMMTRSRKRSEGQQSV